MVSAALRAWWATASRWELAAIALWSAVLLFVCVRVFVAPANRTVYPIFTGSAQLWWNGDDLYEPFRPMTVQDGYRYSPTFAILFTPLALIPDSIGGVIWRVFSTAAFLQALAWMAVRVLPWQVDRKQFAWLALLCLPLSVQSVNNGQANVIVIASMLATIAAVIEKRWNWASAFIALAFVCKVYPLALGMLLILLYPRQLLWRVTLAIAISLAAPFLFQNSNYVLDQYEKWIALLRADDRTEAPATDKHRDLWLLIDLYAIPISRRVYTLLQMLGGVGVAALLWTRQRSGWDEKALLTSTLALGVTWMLVLGPVVESSTFMLLAPCLAFSIVGAIQDSTRDLRKLLLVGSAMLFVAAALLGAIANTAHLNISGIHPMASVLYFAYLLLEPCPQSAAAVPESEWRVAA